MLCGEGRIDGAAKLGREWAIPTNAVKSSDNRITNGRYKGWRNSERNSTINTHSALVDSEEN